MKLSLFDLHCDTAYEMWRQNQSLSRNRLAVSLENADCFDTYIQVMAHWTDSKISDEAGWEQMKAIRSRLLSDPAITSGEATVTTFCPERHCKSLLLSIEDARILCGKIERVEELFALGFRILTPLWAKSTCIGGSHDTNEGLTPFGRKALERAVGLGMILDVSHASERSAEEIFEIASSYRRPVIASHSNAKEICPVSRNLTDGQVKKILASGGVIGLNLYRNFLVTGGEAKIADLLPHVEHFCSLGAESALCLGCDMDGADLPKEIPHVGRLEILADLLLSHNYSEDFVHHFFFENAYSFAAQTFAPTH